MVFSATMVRVVVVIFFVSMVVVVVMVVRIVLFCKNEVGIVLPLKMANSAPPPPLHLSTKGN